MGHSSVSSRLKEVMSKGADCMSLMSSIIA